MLHVLFKFGQQSNDEIFGQQYVNFHEKSTSLTIAIFLQY